ncbi:MAG: TRAP transporter large permease subunit [Desulfatiglans sp.]|nr:TRAP transporter large permease subunit [Thermodesulfobacteriota bacterium]MEE4354681.1 TRAP transporter large permease subunit [Desulfatiglans sp.]
MTRRALGVLDSGTGYLALVSGFMAGVALLTMLSVVVYEIIVRKLFNAPTVWSIELVTFLMIWFCFLTLAISQRQGRHISVDLITSLFSPRVSVWWRIIPLVFSLLCGGILFYYTSKDFWHSLVMGERTPTVWGPAIWPVKLALPVGCATLCLQLISDIASNAHGLISRPRKPIDTSSQGTGEFWDKSFLLFSIFFVLLVISAWMLVSLPVAGLVIGLLVMLFAGVPIFVALTLIGVAGLYLHFGGGLALSQVPHVIDGTLGSFTLAALPLFILTGFILHSSGAGEELYVLFTKWTGSLPGGLGLATILSCTFFAAISISSVATVATIGLIAFPALKSRKYREPLSYGLVGSGATLGIMIPPSGTMILYAAITEESMGRLLIAGILPGLMLVLLFSMYTVFSCWRTGAYERELVDSWKERWQALGSAVWVLLVPIIIVVGIFTGVFTVLECGGIAAFYTIIMVLVRQKIKVRDLPRMLSECGISAGFILIIIAGALIMGRFMTLLQVPQMAMSFITEAQLAPGMVIVAIMFMLLILGLFLEVASVMMITLPVLYPVVTGLGYDGIWFAVMMTLSMELCLLTPPVGLNLYVIQGIAKTRLAPIVMGTIPFYFIMLAGMVILYFVPQITLVLPNLMVR